jgi:hypothetical protein
MFLKTLEILKNKEKQEDYIKVIKKENVAIVFIRMGIIN